MKRALLVIDVQNEYFRGQLPITHPSDSLKNILLTMDDALQNNIPIVVIQHTALQKDSKTFKKGSYQWEIHEDVLNRSPDLILEKNLPGSFTGTELEEWLRSRRVDTVVIAGYMTQMCCDTTARQAMHRGFRVEFLSDATGTLNISNYAGNISASCLHQAILITQAMKFSTVMSTEEWIEMIKEEL
ncbi:MAG TPA: cysteine hydrolase family protein [Methanobacteriaceae archaeon]|nr:cysteine hydrolase family protein [Methanobacteriaceae archaeon]